MPTRAGLVLRGDDALHFIPAELAKCLVAQSEISRVPGANLSMALVGGEVVAVLPLGSQFGALVLCDIKGELVAFSGLAPEAAGFFEAAPGGVHFAKERALDLDLPAALASVAFDLQRTRTGWLHDAQ